ncbi:MAG: ATP-binding cassette domain-containing protein [Alphaproteobacteria bacterium]|nr:ATP-binding cassette domain-containing protein [Alphaproteobacteria bacterium]
MLARRSTTPKPTLVELQGVHKTFANGTVALENLNLAVGEHEFVSLLGPSGCGKSTALRLISRLAGLSAGRLVWSGEVAVGDIGFVFQEPTLMPWASVFDNVYLPLRLQRMSRRAVGARVDEVLDLVGLREFSNAYPRELSGGMKMRASIARALVTEPKLLLMDEPFAALDEITRFRLNDDLLRLWAGRRFTVVFVTHSVFESVYLSERILVMAARPGRIVEEIRVDAPYPRDDAFRTSEPYNAWCREASAALKRAMGES